MYQNYIFDLYGTLVDIRTDENAARFWAKVSDVYSENGASYLPSDLRESYRRLCRAEIAKERLLHPGVRHIDVELTKVFRRLYTKKGVKPSEQQVLDTAKAFRKASTKHIRLYDGALDLLSALKARNKRVFLLSNAQRSFTVPELEQLGILGFFDGILISSDERVCKPEKRFFYALMKKYAIDPKHSVMIGNDQYSDILGAKGVGLDALYIYQDISPAVEDENAIPADYKIMDGNVRRIRELILLP